MADIIHRIGIKAPLSKAYDAVATAEGVAGWWTRDTTGSAGVGEKINVRFRHKDGKEIGQMDFEIIKPELNREVQWRFVAGPPEWVGTGSDSEPDDNGCAVGMGRVTGEVWAYTP